MYQREREICNKSVLLKILSMTSFVWSRRVDKRSGRYQRSQGWSVGKGTKEVLGFIPWFQWGFMAIVDCSSSFPKFMHFMEVICVSLKRTEINIYMRISFILLQKHLKLWSKLLAVVVLWQAGSTCFSYQYFQFSPTLHVIFCSKKILNENCFIFNILRWSQS